MGIQSGSRLSNPVRRGDKRTKAFYSSHMTRTLTKAPSIHSGSDLRRWRLDHAPLGPRGGGQGLLARLLGVSVDRDKLPAISGYVTYCHLSALAKCSLSFLCTAGGALSCP